MPVHVPFDIGDVRAVEHLSDRGDDIVPHLRLCQVEKQLVSPVYRVAPRLRQRPIRVGAVQVAVGIDGLRLEPEPEFHPQLCELSRQPGKAVRQLLVYIIISQSGAVIVSCPEPAVVKNEQLTAELGRFFRQIQQSALGKIEAAALPAVIQHRAFPAAPALRYDMAVYIIVHMRGQPVEARVRKAHDRLRRFKALTRREELFKILR